MFSSIWSSVCLCLRSIWSSAGSVFSNTICLAVLSENCLSFSLYSALLLDGWSCSGLCSTVLLDGWSSVCLCLEVLSDGWSSAGSVFSSIVSALCLLVSGLVQAMCSDNIWSSVCLCLEVSGLVLLSIQ